MDLLQIGKESWLDGFDAPKGANWYHTPIESLEQFLADLVAEREAKLPPTAEGQEPPKIRLRFGAVFLTDTVAEHLLNPIMNMVESSAVFYDETVAITPESATGFFRRKLPQRVERQGEKVDSIAFISRIAFPSQYGAKLKLPEIDVNPLFTGKVSYTGHVHVNFEGDFGAEMTPLFSYRYNLSNFYPMALDLWQEYVKEGNCEIEVELLPIQRGSLYDTLSPIILTEKDLKDYYTLKSKPEDGFYAVTIYAKGSGVLKFGPMHWRYSREGYGDFVLGGKRKADANGQELIYYFNPGDMKPPMNVYFSGYRTAEGFEGFGILKSLKAPFMLIGDPRMEGGGFYTGSKELEQQVVDSIQESLDYLGFDKSQLILSGLSMGSFGALYYAPDFNPHAVVVGKPFTNLGDTATRMKLKRPDDFPTAGDVLLNIEGKADDEAVANLNQKFWDKFSQSEFPDTQFAIAHMEHDDYDGDAIEKLIDHLSQTNAHIYAKGYEGRHNDNSRAINRWFMRQYVDLLEDGFERKFS